MNRKLPILLLVGAGVAVAAFAMNQAAKSDRLEAHAAEAKQESIYEFTMDNIDGEETKLEKYKGDVLLVVNVASRCGHTKQYAGLQTMYEQYKDQGFKVLGFPANNFMGQEPGTEEEIKEFCTTNFGVTFPMFSKISVKGDDTHDLYKWLIATSDPDQEVRWNFEKFLVDRDGKVVARFEPGVQPEDEKLVAAVESAL
jgi:glutathione peroxidase